MTLGAISLANAVSCGSVLQLVSPTAATPYISHPELGDVEAMFFYLTPADYSEYGASAPGWYLCDDGAFEYPMNDFPIPYGMGFLIDCGDEEAQIVYAGEVLKGEQDVDLVCGEYNMTGNAVPAPMTLGDFAIKNGVSCGSDLQFISPTAATPYISHPELGDVEAMFFYLTPADYSEYGASAPGWYLCDDGAFEYPMNDYPIPVGKGFLIDCGDEEAAFVMPEIVAE